jgi:hypothetical protein
MWCFEDPRKTQVHIKQRVTVRILHIFNANVVSLNLIAVGNAAISDLEPLSDELHEKIAECYDGEAKDYIRGPY